MDYFVTKSRSRSLAKVSRNFGQIVSHLARLWKCETLAILIHTLQWLLKLNGFQFKNWFWHKIVGVGNTDLKTRSSFVITKKVFIRMQHSRCNYVSILGSSIFWYIIINSRTFYISKEWVKRYQNWRDERNTGLATQNCCKNWNDEPCTTAAFWRWLNVLFCAGLYWGEFVRNWLFYLY